MIARVDEGDDGDDGEGTFLDEGQAEIVCGWWAEDPAQKTSLVTTGL